jgi:hypothetical protein
MRPAHLLFLACSLAACDSHAETGVAEEKHVDFRSEVAAQFKFTPPPHETPVLEISPVLKNPVSVPFDQVAPADDPEVVKMPAYTVMETIRNRDLHAAIMKGQAQAQAKKVKFGTGLRELRLKRVTLSAVTIFYIPVAVGISW